MSVCVFTGRLAERRPASHGITPSEYTAQKSQFFDTTLGFRWRCKRRRKAAGEWRTAVADAQTSFLDRDMSVDPCVVGDGDVKDVTQAALKSVLHLQGAEVEAYWEHRTGMVADLAPVEADAKERHDNRM